MIICRANNTLVIGSNACRLLIGTVLDTSTTVTILELDSIMIGQIHNIQSTQKKITGIPSGENNWYPKKQLVNEKIPTMHEIHIYLTQN